MNAITLTGRDEWLAARRAMIGASESPALYGEGYRGFNAWTIWADKVGAIPRDENDAKEENEALEWGRESQPVILKIFGRRTGLAIEDYGDFTIQRHPVHPFIGATLDAGTENDAGKAAVECKNVGHYASKDWKASAPPLRVQIQCAHQLLVTGWNSAYAVACVGGNRLAFRRLDRDEKFIDNLLDRLHWFWGLVESKTPPPVDESEATAEVLKRLYPHDKGGVIALPEGFGKWVDQLEQARAASKAAGSAETEAKNQLAAALGDNSMGSLPDGRLVAYRTQNRSGYTVAPAEFRVMRVTQPK